MIRADGALTRLLLPPLMAVGLGASSTPAAAQELPPVLPRHRLVYDNLTILRVNPLGLEDQLSVGYRLRLYDNPGPLYRDAFVGLAFTPTLNPALARVGGTLEIRPLSILALSAGGYFVRWFGSMGHLQSFPDTSAEWSDSDISAGKDASRHYGVTGAELQLRAMALAKAGPIVLRNDLNVFGTSLNLRSGDRVYYTPRTDILASNDGWTLTNDTDLVWLSDFGLVAGVRNTLTHAYLREAGHAPGDDDAGTPTDRVGPLIAYTLFDRPGATFNKPTFLLLANWWLVHPYRTGADVSQALPYLILGFRSEGDLWSAP